MSYANKGETDVAAPLLQILSEQVVFIPIRFYRDGFWYTGLRRVEFKVPQYEFLGIAQEGPAGILPPGAGGRLTLDFTPDIISGLGEISIGVVTTPDEPLRWDEIKDDSRPDHISAEAYDAIWENFTASMGSTVGSYHAVLTENATYLSQIGRRVYSADELQAFEMQQAGIVEISSRYYLGSYGHGMPDPWDVSLVLDEEAGVAVVNYSGLPRELRRSLNSSHLYLDTARGELTTQSGNAQYPYRLDEPGGQKFWFLSNGRLGAMEDTNGNRTIVQYQNDQVSRVDWWNGDSLTLEYTPEGRVSRTTDQSGRTAKYTYDVFGEHLLSVESPDGTTSYTYVTSGPAAKLHAISSITHPTGERVFFEYNDRGRLIRTYTNDGKEPLVYSYDTTGVMSITDAAGATTNFSYDERGQLNRVEDALKRVWDFRYDVNGNLVRTLGPGGVKATYEFDDRSRLIRQTDALGNSTYMTYDDTFDQLSSFRDAAGNVTAFNYDARGNLILSTDAAGKAYRYSYDGTGNLLAATNRRNQSLQYEYDGRHRLEAATHPDGSRVTYDYDGRDNVIAVNDSRGRTRMEYDDADRLTRITYPNGRWLAYEYDEAGRRTNISHHDGTEVRYQYTPEGRLGSAVDEEGNSLMRYHYNELGQLAREDKGNGTYTTYEYDDAEQLTHLLHHASDGMVNSRFDYQYDTLGRIVVADTLEGTWRYDYDPIGQLTRVETPGGRVIDYRYDAVGNRVSVTDDGTIVDYVSNELNQYTVVGDTKLQYDADGNLIGMQKGGEAWKFTFDHLNQLRSATTPQHTSSYEYDLFGSRISQTVDGQRSEYLVDPVGLESVVAEYDAGSTRTATNASAIGLASRTTPASGRVFYDTDVAGSVIGVSQADGNYIENYAYLPFGELLDPSTNNLGPHGFGGAFGVSSDASGLNHMRARYYAPELGRFISRDPLGLGGGQSNLYAYAANSPISLADPSGEVLPALALGFLYSGLIGGAISGGIATVSAVASYDSADPNALRSAAGSVVGTIISGAVYGGFIGLTGGTIFVAGGALGAAGGVANLVAFMGIGGGTTALGYGTEQLIKTGEFTLEGGALTIATGTALGWFPSGLSRSPKLKWTDLLNRIQREEARYAHEFASSAFKPHHLLSRRYFDRIIGETLFVSYGVGALANLTPDLTIQLLIISPFDPNDKAGGAGFGDQGFIVADSLLPFRIRFENDPDLATAAAQEVVITDQLDSNLDWTSFELAAFGFGDLRINPPPGLQEYSTAVESVNPDRSPLWVQVDAGLDLDTGIVTWSFRSVDPATGQLPADPFAGFLHINDESGRGEGFVNFLIQPTPGHVTGARIENEASIVFDSNDPIVTNRTLNTIDAGPPSSAVKTLPEAVGTANVMVEWSGQDDDGGSGIAAYDLYVSRDGGPFEPVVTRTTEKTFEFTGESGVTYGFVTVATDNVGIRETMPLVPDSETLVIIGDMGQPSQRLRRRQQRQSHGPRRPGDHQPDGAKQRPRPRHRLPHPAATYRLRPTLLRRQRRRQMHRAGCTASDQRDGTHSSRPRGKQRRLIGSSRRCANARRSRARNRSSN